MLRNMASVYLFDEDKMLMLYRIGSRVVPPSWCSIGGHFEKEELNNPESCVLRELWEEVGLRKNDISNLQMRYVTLRQKNNEIRQNYYYFADLCKKDFVLPHCDEGILEWVPLAQVMEREMPHSARFCLEHFFSVGKNNSCQYAGVTTESGIEFVELSVFDD